MANLTEYWDDVDVESIPASTGVSDPFPAGDYTMEVKSAELKQTSEQTGVGLSMRYEVVDGQHEGRAVFAFINTRNPNAQAQQIGIGEFKALCLATGVPFEEAAGDTDLLLFKPFRARVVVTPESVSKKNGKVYPPKNEIKKYYPAEAAPAAPAARQPPVQTVRPAAAAAPAKSGGLPWKKSA